MWAACFSSPALNASRAEATLILDRSIAGQTKDLLMPMTISNSVVLPFSVIFAGAALLTACVTTDTDDETFIATPKTDIVSLQPIQSNEMVVSFQLGDREPADWTIVPELNPDRLAFECPDGETIPVTFTTDLETLTIPMTIEQPTVQFEIVVRDDIKALTELKCIEEIPRYAGSFSSDRPTAGDYEADLLPIFDTYFSPDGPGVILSIVEGEQPPFKIAYGLNRLDERLARTPSDTFDIASVSKEFTAVSILQLVEQGKLSLNDPVSKFFDDLPNGNAVTVHHLLSHTHGLPQIRTADDYDDSIPRDVEVSLTHIRDQGAKFSPGDAYDYGNTSYYLLAIIAERVSGVTRQNYLQTHLFEPAGMRESFIAPGSTSDSRETFGYNEQDSAWTPRIFDFHPSHAFGSGDIVSTLDDLRLWQQAVSNGTLLSQDMFAHATTRKSLNDGTLIERGYSFFPSAHAGDAFVYNTGDYVTHTRHFYSPARDLSIILNTNGTPQYDDGQSSVVWIQVIAKVLNSPKIEMFDEELDVNDL